MNAGRPLQVVIQQEAEHGGTVVVNPELLCGHFFYSILAVVLEYSTSSSSQSERAFEVLSVFFDHFRSMM